ncbi:MAG: hypothetical protein CL678_04590 [Bdellovibrionaceae bacterium]|nr:hypothetical protein [Pseudobdellovibrionaceae bacterium]|tara:strand:- start:3543 stop:4583 length:1041 start_codon:yes stop_codon:yes gene_type:complete
MKTMNLILGLTFVLHLSGCFSDSSPKEVNLAIWGQYLPDHVYQKFEKTTGLKLNLFHYASNEELLAKIQAGANDFDVIVPSDYMISVMTQLSLLEPLQTQKIKNFNALDKKLLDQPFDPKNQYSLPFSWGTTGVARNQALYPKKIESWKQIFSDPDLDGKLSLLDDIRETIGMALIKNGHSPNSTDPKQLDQAKKDLIALKPRVKLFDSDTQKLLLSKEVAVAHAYSTDTFQAFRQLGEVIEYAIPKEGCVLWIDNLAIPKGAPHLQNAHLLINFLLEEENMSLASAQTGTFPSHTKSFQKLKPLFQKLKGMIPTPTQLKKCQSIRNIGPEIQLWDRMWTAIKVSS